GAEAAPAAHDLRRGPGVRPRRDRGGGRGRCAARRGPGPAGRPAGDRVSVGARDAAPAFLDGSPAAADAHARALATAARVVRDGFEGADGPLPPVTPAVLDRLLDLDVAPTEGEGLEATLALVGDRIVRNSIAVAHPLCAAHLHCPPLLSSLAAEAVISATNQSLDSWDQAPAATH